MTSLVLHIGARIVTMLANARYTIRNAEGDELASVVLTCLLTVNAWINLWSAFRWVGVGSVLAPSGLFGVVLWAVAMPVWARLAWNSTCRNVDTRRENHYLELELQVQAGRHHAD